MDNTFHCRIPDNGHFSNNEDGLACITKCGNTSCFDDSYVCLTPKKDFISESNGGKCVKKCSNTTKCFRDDYTCADPSSGFLSNLDGGACTSKCNLESHCSGADYICVQAISDNKIKTDGSCGGCNADECYDSISLKCRKTDINNNRTSNGSCGKCETYQCLDSNFVCTSFTATNKLFKLSDNTCSTSCSTCHINRECISSLSKDFLKSKIEADNSCVTSCVGNECYNTTTFKCQDPNLINLSEINGKECKSQCSKGTCKFNNFCVNPLNNLQSQINNINRLFSFSRS